MALQPEIEAKPFAVDTINLQRYGRPLVTLRAHVTDTEQFYFTVPKTAMQVILDSLEVHDTRGNIPRISFPSPMVTQIKPLVLKKKSAWYDLLKHHQGAHVELQTRSGPVEGYFLGFEHFSRYSDGEPSVLLQTDGKVCLHEPGSISSVAFKSAQVAQKLERYTSTLCRIHEEDSVYRINITASGVGAGEVCATFTAAGHTPTFDVSYTIHAQEDADANDNEVRGGGHMARPKVLVRCFAVIRNPLHYDLNDVHFILNTGTYRFYKMTSTYDVFAAQSGDQSSSTTSSPRRSPRRRSRSPSSAIRSRSRSPKRGPAVPAPVPVSPPKSAADQNESDTESNSISDTESASSYSTISLDACRQGHSREWDLPEKISVKEGESVKVFLYETQMEGGVGHHVGMYGEAERSVILHNTTDVVFEPGHAMFFAKGLSVKLILQSLQPGQDQCVHYDPTGYEMKPMKSSRRGEVLCSTIVNKKLVAKVMWYHKERYLMHNKEDEHIVVLLDHKSRQKAGREGQISTRFYTKVSRTGIEDDADGGEELEPYSEKGFLNWVSYLVRVGPKQRCAIVVSETEVRLETYSILDCSKDAIAKMEQKEVVGPSLAEKLRRLTDMRCGLERLKRTSKLYRKQHDEIKSCERELVKAKSSNEAEDGANRIKQFIDAVSTAEDSMAEIEEALDKIKCEVVKVVGQMKAAWQEIWDIKNVDLGKEINENGMNAAA